MFSSDSFVNTCGEYAFDCLSRSDMLLRPTLCKHTLLISTNYGDIVVTPDTYMCTGRNLWKRAEELFVGDSLKHYTQNRAIITGISKLSDALEMYKIIDCKCGYLVVNNFYISDDM